MSEDSLIDKNELCYGAAAAVSMFVLLARARVLGLGAPPYLMNDPGTPGNRNWEINLGYMPFLYNTMSAIHTPDLDINYGVGDRFQLIYENAWCGVKNGANPTAYGLGEDRVGVKRRFCNNEKTGFAMPIFARASLNNPDRSVQRGITPSGDSITLPMQFSKRPAGHLHVVVVGRDDRGPAHNA